MLYQMLQYKIKQKLKIEQQYNKNIYYIVRSLYGTSIPTLVTSLYSSYLQTRYNNVLSMKLLIICYLFVRQMQFQIKKCKWRQWP